MTHFNSTLWKPDKTARTHITHGDWKIKRAQLQAEGLLEVIDCPACGRPVYWSPSENRHYLPDSGAVHKCKGLLDADDEESFL